MDIDWSHELLEQLDWHWQNQLRARLDGLTDAEYLWEPVAGCWSVRRRGESRTATPFGSGDHVVDFAYPAPSPAPVTTIAWRLGHLSGGRVSAGWAASCLRLLRPARVVGGVPGTAVVGRCAVRLVAAGVVVRFGNRFLLRPVGLVVRWLWRRTVVPVGRGIGWAWSYGVAPAGRWLRDDVFRPVRVTTRQVFAALGIAAPPADRPAARPVPGGGTLGKTVMSLTVFGLGGTVRGLTG